MSAPLLIADSGPLIALARLDLLFLPKRYFSEVLVTAMVWEEVTRKPREDEADRLTDALSRGFLRLVADPEPAVDGMPAALAASGIDLGERTVIALARELGAAVLIDDQRGRRAAQQLALPVVGTVGLLARARVAGVVGPLRPIVERLSATGYFLSADTVGRVLAELGE